jgi:hypothetical protein
MMIPTDIASHQTFVVCATCPKIEIAMVAFILGVVTCMFLMQVYRVLWKEELER